MKEKDTKPYWSDALGVFARMSGWIAFPVIFGLFLGKWLDAKYETAPYLFLVIMGFAFLVSAAGIVKETKRYIASVEKKKDESNISTN